MKERPCSLLAFICHVELRIYMGEEIGMIDPDYDSMADYVDVESMNATRCFGSGQSPEQAFKIIQLSPVIIHVHPCNGMLL